MAWTAAALLADVDSGDLSHPVGTVPTMAVDARQAAHSVQPRPGCGVYENGARLGAESCNGEPVAAVEVSYSYDGSVWLVFLCARHGDCVPETRPLTADDLAELEDRRQRTRRALAGRGWEPTKPIRPGRRRR